MLFISDVIGQVVNVGSLENVTAKGKSSTKLELSIRDIRLELSFSVYNRL